MAIIKIHNERSIKDTIRVIGDFIKEKTIKKDSEEDMSIEKMSIHCIKYLYEYAIEKSFKKLEEIYLKKMELIKEFKRFMPTFDSLTKYESNLFEYIEKSKLLKEQIDQKTLKINSIDHNSRLVSMKDEELEIVRSMLSDSSTTLFGLSKTAEILLTPIIKTI